MGWCKTSLQHTNHTMCCFCCVTLILLFFYNHFTAITPTTICFISISCNHLHVQLSFFFLITTWPHQMSEPYHTRHLSNILYFGHSSHHMRTLTTAIPVEAHAIPTFSFSSFFGLGFPFCTPCHTGGAHNCNPTLDTMYPCTDYREGDPGLLGNLISRFLCLLSFCTLVTSNSPHESLLLLALLVYDSTYATLLNMLLCDTPTFPSFSNNTHFPYSNTGISLTCCWC